MMEDFYKDMKKHFQERKIQPSKNAWDKMVGLLNEQQAKSKKSNAIFYFLSLAASIALLFGIWTIFKKSDVLIPETNSTEIFVVNEEQEMVKPMKPEKPEKQEDIKEKKEIIAHHVVKKNDSKHTNQLKIIEEEYIVLNSDVPNEEIVSIPKKEEIISVDKIKEEPLLAVQSKVEITVNPQRLLQSAEIERQIENATTEVQVFWRKVAEKHQLVQSH